MRIESMRLSRGGIRCKRLNGSGVRGRGRKSLRDACDGKLGDLSSRTSAAGPVRSQCKRLWPRAEPGDRDRPRQTSAARDNGDEGCSFKRR